MTAVSRTPNFSEEPLKEKMSMFEKSGLPKIMPISGLMTLLTRESTMSLKALPMMKPTAISMTLPRVMNSLKPLSMGSPV